MSFWKRNVINGCAICYGTVVTISTTNFNNIKNLHTLPIYVRPTQTATISLNTVTWLVFVTEMQHI